jgi:hypothetical protein
MIILCPEINLSGASQQNKTKSQNGTLQYMRKGIFILFLAFASLGLYAQNTLEAGLYGGVSYYIGDINPSQQFKQIKPAYGAVARYNVSMRWAFTFAFTTSDLIGDDLVVLHDEDRALNFSSRIYDGSLMAEFNFFDYFTGSKKNYVSPYIFGGVSFFHFTPRNLNGDLLRPEGTEGQFAVDPATNERIGPEPYSQFGFSIPFGLGVKYSLTKRLGLAVEWRMHKTFTDYIDDISTVYYQETVAPSGLVFAEGMQRGDRNTNDWFSFAGISLTYKFNLIKRANCLDLDGVQNW